MLVGLGEASGGLMLIIHAYTVLGELHVSAQTTLGSVIVRGIRYPPPALHTGAYQVDKATCPQDLVQAVCQMVDDIEHDTHGNLYAHLEA